MIFKTRNDHFEYPEVTCFGPTEGHLSLLANCAEEILSTLTS